MTEAFNTDGIYELAFPQRVNAGEWLENHLDCDSIVDDLGTDILVYAYATNPIYNQQLAAVKKQKYMTQTVLRGVSSVGLNSIL